MNLQHSFGANFGSDVPCAGRRWSQLMTVFGFFGAGTTFREESLVINQPCEHMTNAPSTSPVSRQEGLVPVSGRTSSRKVSEAGSGSKSAGCQHLSTSFNTGSTRSSTYPEMLLIISSRFAPSECRVCSEYNITIFTKPAEIYSGAQSDGHGSYYHTLCGCDGRAFGAIADCHLPEQPWASAAGDLHASKSGIHSLASSSRSRQNYYSGSACCLLGSIDVITGHSRNADGIRIHSQIARKESARGTD